MAIPASAAQFIDGVLRDIGAPVTATTQQGFIDWLANEQGGPDLTSFEANKGNPLGIQTPEAQAAGKSGNLAQGIALTAQLLKSNYAGIVNAFKTAKDPQSIATAVVASPWNGNRYGGVSTFMATAGGTATGNIGSSPDSATVPATTFDQPEAGVNPANFHGYNLSAIPANELGNAEKAIQQYITDPGYATQLQQRMSQDYGYQIGWTKNLPEVNAVLIWAAASLDPTSAAGKNQFQSAIANTSWWKTTDANQRSWQQVQGTDPAQASQALGDAQEKVLADANQMGVTLSKQELDGIANMYAAQTFVQSGSLGSQSGTASEWLDQAITDTVLNIKNQKAAGLQTDFAPANSTTSTFDQQTQGGTNPSGLFGISQELYNGFQQIAQQYLMYNPNNPSGSLLTEKSLLSSVQQALQNYTGTGSSFGSSNLISGAEAQFTQQMMTQASQLYPSLAPSIQAGTTPQAYVQPYQSVISNMLGIDPASINFTDPQWNWVIATPDAKTGQKTALTLDQVQQKLATTPQFDQSNNAQQMADSVTQQLSSQMGFGGK